jgi:hypothetical protein
MSRIRRALVIAAGLTLIACDHELGTALGRQIEAQRLAADMRVQLHRSAEGVQQAIMADTDELSAGFARDAQAASSALEADLHTIEPILAEIGSQDEVRIGHELAGTLARLSELDRSLLGLAVENTNVKAQRLAFGPARAAADGMREALEGAVRAAPEPKRLRAELLAARTLLAVREIQVLQAPHIAEADDAEMTRLEARMAASEAAARSALAELSSLLGPVSQTELATAGAKLDAFAQAQRELVALSRQNTDVRSLAVALGDRRTLTASCEASLVALQESLSKHGLEATR